MGKVFDVEMLSRTLSITFFQIFHKIFHNSKVTVNSIMEPDNNF